MESADALLPKENKRLLNMSNQALLLIVRGDIYIVLLQAGACVVTVKSNRLVLL